MLNLEIDVSAVLYNIEKIRARTRASLNAVIKANCYGHGLELAARIEPYVDSFSVSSVSEAEDARAIGLKKKIYILGTIDPNNFKMIDDVVYTVCSKEDIDFLLNLRYNFNVGIKVNTGMNRLGVRAWKLKKLVDLATQSDKLNLDSVYTHFYDIAEIESHKEQAEIFNKALAGIEVKKHCCASNFFKLGKKYHMDIVRCGLALYGYGHDGLKPALSAYATVAQINRVKAGEHVGYGNYVLCRDAKVAIVRAGYADGYRRTKTKQYVSAEGKRCPLVGQVSMDMLAVDVTGTDINRNDKIYLIDKLVSADYLAKAGGTIVYEVLTAFNGQRVRRTFIG